MHTELTKLSDTKIKLTITATTEDLIEYKNKVLNKLAKDVKLSGFRGGKAPISLVERNVDQNLLQTEFLDEAMSNLYYKSTISENIRPVTKPEVTVKKFVPFSSLEFDVETEVIGNIKVGDYKKVKLAKEKPAVVAKDVNDVLESLLKQSAEKKEVDRAAKKDDEVIIDFLGKDTKEEPISGADGKDYPLVLGSNAFIPGFEDNVIGMKPRDEKTFTLTFPKEYGVKALASKKVSFTVNVKKVQEVVKPKLDDEFASKVGPFKTLKDLKDDIKKQLLVEKQRESDRKFQNDLVGKIVEKSTAVIPESLIDQQINYSMDDLKRNLTYRGQTLAEYLEQEGMSEDEYRNKVAKPQAELTVKTSLILSEIAEAEKVVVTPEELEIRMQILKGQYQDPAMQANLDKPEARQDIASRMVTEKVLQKLEEYATK